jgi:tRNA1Val (adenine37-N6)-methyltransferase
MLAQRTSDASRREQTKVELGVEIDAIEFNAAAASDCLQNFSDSRWQNRLKLVHDRFQNWIPRAAHRYDLIVSNPPYFQAEARNRATPRATARHDRELSIDDLLYGASTLLTTRGRLSLILPTTRTAKVIESAKQFGFFWSRRLSVRSLPDKSPHRDLLEFRFTRGDVEHEQLTIEREHHHYTEDFRALAQDFYLAF